MTPSEELRQIYVAYDEKLAKVKAKASAFAGAFNMGDDPRKDSCHQVFYDTLEEWVDAYAETAPQPAAAAEAVTVILDAAGLRRSDDTYWYTYAAQKHACKLIPFLTPEDALTIRERFAEQYPKLDWTPVQKEVLKALNAKTKDIAPQVSEQQTDPRMLLWAKRVAMLLVGLTIAHLGVTLFLLADLGSDPFNVMIQGLFRLTSSAGITALTHGTVHVAVSLLIILVLLVVDKSYIRIGTFLCMILGGPIIDLFSLLLGAAVNSGSPMLVRALAVILGCGILAFGMTIVIKSQAGTGPNDLVAVVISDKRKWPFGYVRVAVDVSFAAIGFLLGGTVGLGTLICMAVVGPVAQCFMPFSEKLCGKIIGE